MAEVSEEEMKRELQQFISCCDMANFDQIRKCALSGYSADLSFRSTRSLIEDADPERLKLLWTKYLTIRLTA